MKIRNHHERIVAAPPGQIAALIADFDRVWPAQITPAPRWLRHRFYDAGPMLWEEFDRPGAVRAFRVVRPDELQGEHWFELEPAESATVLRHTLEGCAAGKYEAIWHERIEPLHDQILEALLDNVETTAASGATSTVSSLVGVHDVPEAVRSLTTLTDPDYIDLFTVTTPAAADKPAEQWARAVLEYAGGRPARVLWRLMGLRLGPRHSPGHVQGWKIAARGANWLRVETASWYMTAQAVCLVEEGQVSISLSLRYDRPIAALVWAVVSGPHQQAIPGMLREAAGLMTM